MEIFLVTVVVMVLFCLFCKFVYERDVRRQYNNAQNETIRGILYDANCAHRIITGKAWPKYLHYLKVFKSEPVWTVQSFRERIGEVEYLDIVALSNLAEIGMPAQDICS